MSNTKNYVNWIAGLTKDQFDDFIKAFLKDFWKVETISITDGTGDGGIDIKIIENNRQIKVPIQLTIDKNVYSKLERDLTKISKLIKEHDFSYSFYFYYSRGASEDKVMDLIDNARLNHSIDLKIFDNKLIATYLDKPDYFLSRESLRNFLGGFLEDEVSYFDDNQKLYFDYLSYSDDSKELKERFIVSFILNVLYKNYGSDTSLTDIIVEIKIEFGVDISEKYCGRLINNLITIGKIIKCPNEDYILSEKEKESIKEIRDDSEILERNFSNELQELINIDSSHLEIRIVIEKLKAIFLSQTKIDLNEISNEVTFEDTDIEIYEFHKYVKECFNGSDGYKKFIENTFKLCMKNNFLAKISAGKLFKDLMDNPEFSAYSKREHKEIFIDTPILIYLLLVMKEPHYEYENYKFKIAKELFELIISSNKLTSFNTTQLYIIELSDYFKSAIKLIPLQELGLFESLGGSNNEILNLYISLNNDGLFTGSFRQYLESFDVSIEQSINDDKNEYLNQKLIRIFKDNSILVDDIPPYNTGYQTRNDYNRIENTLTDVYVKNDTSRRRRSLKFDALLFTHIHMLDELVDPTILTWDKTFNEFRKEFQPKNPNFRYWHLFSPGKFLDHISLLNFKINGSSISKEILSLIEMEYEVIESVRKLADVLISIVDLKSKTGINLSKGLADIRDTYIYQIQKDNDEITTYDSNQPVDDVISNLIEYYRNSRGEFTFDDFIESLRIDNVINELLKILQEETNYYLTNKKLSKDYQMKFDNVIKNLKSN